MIRLFLIFLVLPANLTAQEFLTPEEFSAYVDGKTLYFSQSGQPYGIEQYLPDQQSIWQYADGTCTRGIWYAKKQQICFVYDGDGAEQCWHFLQNGPSYAVRLAEPDPAPDLEVVGRDDRPIACIAPGVGV